MKKLLVISLLSVLLLLSGCTSAPQDKYVTQGQYEALLTKHEALQDEFDLLVDRVVSLEQSTYAMEDYISRMVWYGYLLPEGQESENYTMSRSGMMTMGMFEQLGDEKDYIDKNNFPVYIFDMSDNYINVADLGDLLTQKYLGMSSTTTLDAVGRLKIQVNYTDQYSEEELIVRLSMLLMELDNYDFYTLGYPIHIEIVQGANYYMNVPSTLLTSSKYDLHPAMIWNQLFEVYVHNLDYDVTNLQTMYDEMIASGDYDGYVLPNFK